MLLWFATEKGRASARFRMLFGFEPERLTEPRCRKEVLIRLTVLASEVQSAGSQLAYRPDSARRKRQYEHSFSRYDSAFRCIQHFDPLFAARIPHWSELADCMRRWISGTPVDDVILGDEGTRRLKIVAK